ncbi:MAG: TonB-dependent receptor, partial [Flavobacteriales bacterium]|nr:TonB-dependent receptor [Flavobacteriales bacterium]
PGTQPEDNVANNVDNNLTFGTGESYGVELFVKKAQGDLNGWIGYTLSRTTRTFLEIDEGRTFPAKFDRTHDLSVVMNYKLNEKWSFGGAFVYGTGNAITLPQQIYFVENNPLFDYGDRNSFRMDPYHRVDISATLTPKNTRQMTDPETGELFEKNRRIQSTWSFSIYNLYSRLNPYFIYFSPEGNFNQGTANFQAFQVSLFPILPSVTWNFKF